MQCRNCSGNEFRKTSSGNYKCSYCGTLYYPERKSSTAMKMPRNAFLTAAAVILIVLGAVVLVLQKPCGKGDTETRPATGNGDYTFANIEKLPEPAAEVLSVDAIPDVIGNMYFLVMCKNTGNVAIRKPHVTIRLFSDKNKKIATGSGYSFADNLNPGDETPVYVLVRDCPEYSRHETDFTPELPYIIPEKGVFKKVFSAEITETSLRPGPYSGSFKIRGKIFNRSSYTGNYVQAAVVLYNKSRKVIGYGSSFISEKKLRPGDFDFFEISFHSLEENPDHYRIFYYGRPD